MICRCAFLSLYTPFFEDLMFICMLTYFIVLSDITVLTR